MVACEEMPFVVVGFIVEKKQFGFDVVTLHEKKQAKKSPYSNSVFLCGWGKG